MIFKTKKSTANTVTAMAVLLRWKLLIKCIVNKFIYFLKY